MDSLGTHWYLETEIVHRSLKLSIILIVHEKEVKTSEELFSNIQYNFLYQGKIISNHHNIIYLPSKFLSNCSSIFQTFLAVIAGISWFAITAVTSMKIHTGSSIVTWVLGSTFVDIYRLIATYYTIDHASFYINQWKVKLRRTGIWETCQ